MPTTFRLATTTDLDEILLMMQAYYAYEGFDFREMEARQALHEIINQPEWGRLWLITDDEKPVGYVALAFGFSLQYHGRDAFIDEFYIEENHRGIGVGRKAMRFVEEVCRSSGIKALHLEVVESNKNALLFYKKNGFVEHQSHFMSKWL